MHMKKIHGIMLQCKYAALSSFRQVISNSSQPKINQWLVTSTFRESEHKRDSSPAEVNLFGLPAWIFMNIDCQCLVNSAS